MENQTEVYYNPDTDDKMPVWLILLTVAVSVSGIVMILKALI